MASTEARNRAKLTIERTASGRLNGLDEIALGEKVPSWHRQILKRWMGRAVYLLESSGLKI